MSTGRGRGVTTGDRGCGISACDGCLRRGYLVGRLSGSIAGLMNSPRRRAPGLLALDDAELITAVAGDEEQDVRDFLEGFDVTAARGDLGTRSVQAICRHDNGYPAGLLDLDDPPAVLFAAGSTDARCGIAPADATVALVGTRKPSPYGLEVAYDLGRGLGAAGVTVVSGLALGIDAAAHRGCLDGGGAAVAVLAGGADVPYPLTNRRLYERIRADGLVVSELPPGQRAYRWAFPARNRIMAGLAGITVVVEAANPSGSLITSVFAADLGRTVAAVPGRITSRFSAGSNKLLAEGARIVTSAQDLLDELHSVGWQGPAPASVATPDGSSGGTAGGFEPAVTDAVEERALDALEAGLGIDGVCAHSGLPAREARALLARLESTGRLRRDGLGGYRRTAPPGVAGRRV